MQSKKKIHSKISHSEDALQEGHNARREYKISRWWFRLVFVLFIGTVVYILFFSDFMRITTITVSGTHVLTESDIERSIQEELDDKFLGVIPRNTFPFVGEKMIERKLEDTFRRIDTVWVNRVFPDTVNAVIVEHEAVLVWCRDQGKSDCYMIDRNGVAYEHVDWSSPDIVQNDQVTVIDEKGYEVILNDAVLAPEYVEQLMHVRGAIGRASGIGFNEDIIVPSRISNEARLEAQEGWIMLVGLAHPLEQTERTIKTFFEKTVFEKSREELEYVDARVAEKVFYRFKGDPVESDEEKEVSDEEAEGIDDTDASVKTDEE